MECQAVIFFSLSKNQADGSLIQIRASHSPLTLFSQSETTPGSQYMIAPSLYVSPKRHEAAPLGQFQGTKITGRFNTPSASHHSFDVHLLVRENILGEKGSVPGMTSI